MKKIVLGAALAALAGSAYAAEPVVMQEPAHQLNPFSGHVEGYLGGLRISVEDFSDSFLTYGGAARLNYRFNQRWNVQGDLFFDNIDIDEADVNLHGYGAAGHVYWRDPSSFAVGGFASIERYGGAEFIDDLYSFSVGPEGQVYFGNITLYGQAYYGQLRASGESEHIDRWGLRGVVRYFARENLRFDGEIGYHQLSDVFGSGVDLDTFSLAAQANYRFSGTPLTLFGRYQYDNFSTDGADADADVHKFLVGLRASFGGDTLLAEDRYGATMDVWRPNFVLPLPFL